ncbi:hypothetical protein [Nocardia terpenica]|uniref:Uncharacterized protein n=1 Tax=Nocardia terpenica TaxID=455432 RepID=A0A291RU05_9NOCA|nr:hypothetical protein [Nocardia terpenica]ATL70780.1 hypothetical protein CRH09_35960 [Nocardia terpenica]
MSIEVITEFGDPIVFADAIGFRTEEDYNNLEVSDANGHILAAYAGGKWVAAIMLSDEDD